MAPVYGYSVEGAGGINTLISLSFCLPVSFRSLPLGKPNWNRRVKGPVGKPLGNSIPKWRRVKSRSTE